MEQLLQAVLGGLGAMLVGMFAGAAIVAITYTVYERISRSNLGRLVRQALRSHENQDIQQMAAEALQIAVESKNGETISLSALKKMGGDPVKITLTGTSVDDSICVGMEMTV